MAWQTVGRCRSYSRSRRVNGRVVREYCGVGLAGALAEARDLRERERRETERAARDAERARLDAEEAERQEAFDAVQLIAEAALLVAGCKRHRREWRKPRGRS